MGTRHSFLVRSRLLRPWHRAPRTPSTADPRPRVLVTGAGGVIGGILREGLAGSYAVHGLDVNRGPGAEWVADMTSLRRIEPAFAGMSAVVDLAAKATVSESWSSVRETDWVATLNALEAARNAGVERVVFASSNHIVGMYERDEPYASVVSGRYDGLDPQTFPRIGADAPIRPDGPYGVGKALGEAAGRYYAEEYGMSVICLRIGTVNRSGRPTNVRQFATLLTIVTSSTSSTVAWRRHSRCASASTTASRPTPGVSGISTTLASSWATTLRTTPSAGARRPCGRQRRDQVRCRRPGAPRR